MSAAELRAELDQRIEAVESGYEFMLAYAAQGRETDKGAAAGRNVREYLEKMAAALDGLGSVVAECAYSVDSALRGSASRSSPRWTRTRGSRTAPCGSCFRGPTSARSSSTT